MKMKSKIFCWDEDDDESVPADEKLVEEDN